MEIIATHTLTRTDVEKRLAVTSKSLRHFPRFLGQQHTQHLWVEDLEDNRIWWFKLIIRRTGRYRKPVLSEGWREFAKSKKLQIGDKVTFLLEEDQTNGRLKYLIKVVRKAVLMKPVTLFGVAIGYVPTSSAA